MTTMKQRVEGEFRFCVFHENVRDWLGTNWKYFISPEAKLHVNTLINWLYAPAWIREAIQNIYGVLCKIIFFTTRINIENQVGRKNLNKLNYQRIKT